MVLNSTTQSVVINSLTPGGMYIAKVASLTAGGIGKIIFGIQVLQIVLHLTFAIPGPYSLPTTLHMDPQNIVR